MAKSDMGIIKHNMGQTVAHRGGTRSVQKVIFLKKKKIIVDLREQEKPADRGNL